MLKIALSFKDELNKLFLENYLREEYKYYLLSTFINKESFNDKEFGWGRSSFVSIDDKNKILGFLSFTEEIRVCSINNISIINFIKSNIFNLDLFKFFKYMYNLNNIQKIGWNVIVGNPVEKKYDRICKRYNGYIVGIQKREVMLNDRKFYDKKLYEILK